MEIVHSETTFVYRSAVFRTERNSTVCAENEERMVSWSQRRHRAMLHTCCGAAAASNMTRYLIGIENERALVRLSLSGFRSTSWDRSRHREHSAPPSTRTATTPEGREQQPLIRM